jgi:hypothetical protein
MNTENMIKIIDILVWPSVVLIGWIFFFVFFRKDVSNIINRIRSVGKGAIEIGTTSGARKEAATKTGSTARRKFMENLQSVILLEQEQRIKDDLLSEGLESNEDKIDVLVRELARTQLDYDFLDIYYLIYGSELRLLQYLNSITEAVTDGQLNRYIDAVRTQFPNRPNIESRESFMSILVASNLVTRNNNGYLITELGREFLAWIVRQGKRQDLSN